MGQQSGHESEGSKDMLGGPDLALHEDELGGPDLALHEDVLKERDA